MEKGLLLLFLLTFSSAIWAQQHAEQDHSKYIPPTDEKVKAKLSQWQNVKFGLMMHWGTYSQWGVVESWSLCPEDEGWCVRRGPHSHDWNVDSYWWPYFPPKDRNSSYDPKKYPDLWKKFQDFTYNQIEELMTGYGSVDILWLDGGWVRPYSTIDPTISWQKAIPYEQDIDMARIAKMARRHQPGLLVVDRTVTGEFENYVTPEQQIPDQYMPIPWESCMTMGTLWSYVPKENFKSAHQLVHTLVDIVAKGGNLLLNVAPGPDGEWHDEAYTRLQEVGTWMDVNSESIYDTRPLAPYHQGKWAFTQKGQNTYATYLADAGESLPGQVKPEGIDLPAKARVKLLGNEKNLSVKNGFIEVPAKAIQALGARYAYVFRIDA